MCVIVTCKYEKDPMKNSGENAMTLFSHIITLWDFFRRSMVANTIVRGLILTNFELI